MVEVALSQDGDVAALVRDDGTSVGGDIFVEGAWIAASGGFISVAVAIGMSVCSSTPSRLRSGALRSLGAISSIAASMPEVAAWQRASIAGSPT